MHDLLYEIGTEELPAGFVKPALAQLHDGFIKKAAELKITHGAVTVKGTPRRLVLMVSDVAARQQDIKEELLGPSVQVGVNADGSFTKAAEGFARSKGATVADLSQVATPRGTYLLLVREVAGKDSAELLGGILLELLQELSFAKSMRWGANRDSFARPIQWLLALFAGEVIALEQEGIVSSNTTMGHRFHHNYAIPVSSATEYEQLLLDHDVVVDIDRRRELVLKEISRAVAEAEHFNVAAQVAIDEDLVDLVTNLVEKPCGICGGFAEKFLELPDEVLITSMREHQKYFPVVDEKGALLPGFVAVNNTKVKDAAITQKGHERVLRARLEDALFFYKTDCTTSLNERRAQLGGIVFQAQLGTMLEKSERLVTLASSLAKKIGVVDIAQAERAAVLSKADLLSDMVGEFPSLQGVMGAAYARNDGEADAVALAIKEQYMPKRAGAALPSSDLGAIVGLADRLDTIAGCFGIGEVPTGTADPFGLRRLSLAVLNIVLERGYRLSLGAFVGEALALYGDKVDGSAAVVQQIVDFIRGRFTNDCVARGIEAGIVEAVTSVAFDDVCDAVDRVRALETVRNEQSFPLLAASFKRIRNIIKKNQTTEVDTALFADEAEQILHQAVVAVEQSIRELLERRDYVAALHEMLKLKQPIDTFFEEVMVMADDQAVRTNRLNLLTSVNQLVFQIADISKIHDA